MNLTPVLATSPYAGPPDLTLVTGLTSWTFDAGGFLLVAGLAWAYVAGIRAVRRTGERWSLGRTLWFAAGLVVIALTTMSFLGAYAHTLFWVTAAQLALLLTVAPVLLALGAPVTLLVRARPSAGRRVERFLARGPVRLLTFPVIGAVVVACVPFLVYYTPVFEASLRFAPLGWLLHAVVLVVGFAFYWPVLSVDRPPRVHYFPLTVVVMAETLFDAVPGIALWLGTTLIAGDYYRAVGRPWGRSLLSDQQFGGIVLWGIGELVGVPLLMLVVIQWMRSDAVEAARIDRELDLAEDAAAEARRRDGQGPQGIARNGEE
jgi:cytochrome c oxidase assembly factor CtaG